MKNNCTIIFDFDGVIADSFEVAFEVAQMARPTLTRETYKNHFNGNINKAKYADEPVNKIDFMKEYGARFEELPIDEQKAIIIKELSDKYRLFIVSSTNGDIIKSYLDRHGILSCFTEILGNEIHESKVEKFQMLFDKFGTKPDEAAFVTDTIGDMKEARAAGIQTIVGITGGYQDTEILQKENPTVIVDDFRRLYEFVNKKLCSE